MKSLEIFRIRKLSWLQGIFFFLEYKNFFLYVNMEKGVMWKEPGENPPENHKSIKSFSFNEFSFFVVLLWLWKLWKMFAEESSNHTKKVLSEKCKNGCLVFLKRKSMVKIVSKTLYDMVLVSMVVKLRNLFTS